VKLLVSVENLVISIAYFVCVDIYICLDVSHRVKGTWRMIIWIVVKPRLVRLEPLSIEVVK
jgi:hypothetical protein